MKTNELQQNQSAANQKLLIVGDSLSAAYGMDINDGWVSLLNQKLTDEGYSYEIVNASISGDTTESGVERIKPLLERHLPAVVMIELGANDGLRGLPLDIIRDNIESMVVQSQQTGSEVILAGMLIPPNYGMKYTEMFADIFISLSEKYKTALIPFLLENVGGIPSLNLEDGIHPNEKAQPIILQNVWPYLEPLLVKSTSTENAEG